MRKNYAPALIDAKRAATLVVHFGRRDIDGVNEVLRQIRDEEPDPELATGRLIFGICEMYAGILPTLHTPRGLALLTQVVIDLSHVDLDEDQ